MGVKRRGFIGGLIGGLIAAGIGLRLKTRRLFPGRVRKLDPRRIRQEGPWAG